MPRPPSLRNKSFNVHVFHEHTLNNLHQVGSSITICSILGLDFDLDWQFLILQRLTFPCKHYADEQVSMYNAEKAE